MLCIKPFMKGDLAFGCGQCMPCRHNQRRIWTHRIVLEAFKHELSTFLTLTYAPEYLPPDLSVNPRHLTLFLKRLRKIIRPHTCRYFGVGEYGDETDRPHYHLAIFGIGPDSVNTYLKAWGMGNVMAGTLTLESAQYIAGYVTKKMTSVKDPRLNGRHPEFARMSLKPGIGAGALEELEDFFYTDTGNRLLIQTKDVPLALLHGGRQWPLGRYLRRKLREALQIPQPTPENNPHIKRSLEEMSALYEASQARTKWQKLVTYQKANRPKIRSLIGRTKLYKKVKPL